jgi:hypothetical protein
LNPGSGTETYHALRAEADVFEVKHRIRRHAAESCAKLEIMLELMAYEGGVPLLSDPADRL